MAFCKRPFIKFDHNDNYRKIYHKLSLTPQNEALIYAMAK